MSGQANSRSPLLLVNELPEGIVEVVFSQNGCRLVGQGRTLEEARASLQGRIAVFKQLDAFVKAELKYRKVAKHDFVDFVQRCIRVHLRRQYPMIRLAQVSHEMKALGRVEGGRVEIKYERIVTKIFNLSIKSRAS